VKAALQWLASNSALMFLALILATLAWIVSIEEGDPTIEGVYPQPVSVVSSEPPEGLLLVGESDDVVVAQAQVTIRAPQSVWDNLNEDDFVAQVDLTGLSAGLHAVPIEIVLLEQPTQILEIEPEYVTVELEPEAERTVPVRAVVQGNPTLGYLTRTPVVTPREVVVSGPSSYVERVNNAVVQVSVQDASADVEGTYRLQLQDATGQTVPYVKPAQERVEVRVPIELSVYYRPLVVKVVLEGQFASGYRITDISVDPPSVTVFGSPNVIAALPGYIETAPISLDGARQDVIARPALNVPSNVSIVLDEQPVVRVSIEPIQSSLTRVITPEIQGLEPSFTATVSPATVELILSGPMPVLDTLAPNAARVLLNLLNLMPGMYQIEPQIIVPEGVTAQGVNPATVQVEIFIAPTPTPGGG
jgi:YbbR domain-containing protein